MKSQRENKFFEKVMDVIRTFEYKFDEYFSMGIIYQFAMLLIGTLVVLLLGGILVAIFGPQISVGHGIWYSFLHMIDPGTIGADETVDKFYVIVMLFVTIFGLIIMGIIIGILDNAIESRMDMLNEGVTKVMEKGHTLIIGYDDNCPCIVYQQMQSNENYAGNRSIVILDDMKASHMRSETFRVVDQYKQMEEGNGSSQQGKKSKLVFRSGSVISEAAFQMVSLEHANAIIINKDDDFEVIRIILAISNYLSSEKIGVYGTDQMPNIVTLMHDESNIEAAKLAAKLYDNRGNAITDAWTRKIQIIYIENLLARIIAQVCRQPGLSWIFSEIFDYSNSEIYIEKESKGVSLKDMGFVGKTFHEISMELETSVALGIQKAGGEILLNPLLDEVFEEGDRLIHLALDDNEIEIGKGEEYSPRFYSGVKSRTKEEEESPSYILIFGWSKALKEIVTHINDFVVPGSVIKVISKMERDQEEYDELFHNEDFCNISIEHVKESPYSWKHVERYLNKERKYCDDNQIKITNILLLCQDDIERNEADKMTAVLLLNLRNYLNIYDPDNTINITSEMNMIDDQKLLQTYEINDFVVSGEIANRIMTQVANNPDMYKVFYYLLCDEGSEIYLRFIEDYIDVNNACTFQDLSEKAFEKDEIAMGWIRFQKNNQMEIRLNPKGAPKQLDYSAGFFRKGDRLIVLSED